MAAYQHLSGMVETVAAKAQQPTTLAFVFTLLIITLTTRLITGKPESGKDGARIPSTPGYWFPYLGHVPEMAWNTDGFLASVRNKIPGGIFCLHFFGQSHTIVHRPQLSKSLVNKPHSVADEQWIGQHLMMSNFGFRKSDMALFWKMFPDVHSQYKYLYSEPSLSELVNATIKQLKSNIADLITFNTWPSDQMGWEQLAEAEPVETALGQVMEADLMELIKNFVAKTAHPALFGTDFAENFPDLPELIWIFDEAFILLAMNFPSWVPLPKLRRAHLARRRMASYFHEYHEALEKHFNGEDPGARWQDLDNVSIMVKERTKTYREHGMPMEARAACDISIAWAMHANSSPLVFWMLYELFRDSVLLEQIREEISPYIQAAQPKNEFGMGIWIPPRLKEVNIDGLVTKCPLLKCAYVETMRMYTGSWSIKWIKEDTLLQDGEESYLLRKGTYAHANQELHQFDPLAFPDPNEWQARRHLRESVDENGKTILTADLGNIRPFGTPTTLVFAWDANNLLL